MPAGAGRLICGLYLKFLCGTQRAFHIELMTGDRTIIPAY